MRIVTYESERGPRAGLLSEGTVIDAWDALGGGGASLRELLAADRLGELANVEGAGAPLAELGLIDEYEFVVQPTLVGHGPTLFAGLSKRVDLRLIDRLEFGSGAVAMRYEPRT